MGTKLQNIIESTVISTFNRLPTEKQRVIVDNDGTYGFIAQAIAPLYLTNEQINECFESGFADDLHYQLMEMLNDSFIQCDYNPLADRTEAWRVYYTENCRDNMARIEFYDYALGSIEDNQEAIKRWSEEIGYDY